MKLQQCCGKKVKLTDTDGEVFVGKVTDYIYSDDNEPKVEGIVLDYPVRGDGFKYIYPVEFDTPEIKSIEIIE